MLIQWIDGIPYRLKAPFDFSFLQQYGKVFQVFDDQDSGNICFGLADTDKRYFLKFAGAPTERACISAEEAVANLKCGAPVYRDLAHPNLVTLLDAEAIGGGFALIFEWTDGLCMGRQYPLSRETFRQLPIETKLRIFEDILVFHAHVAARGYAAIDFYDGSVLYDFQRGVTLICDIDFYVKMPYVNRMGRLWGSSRFMSPEEFQLGAEIDEITNVYTMGAMAFALFADSECSPEVWPLDGDLYAVARRAVSDDRSRRQQSIEQLIAEWNIKYDLYNI